MSGINGLGGDLPPAKRSRTDSEESQSSVDVLTGLENELRALPDDQYNYDLVRRVEAYRTQHQTSLDSSGLQSLDKPAFGVFVNTTSMRVERLYTNVLAKHRLPANYKDDLDRLIAENPDIARISFLSSCLDDEHRGEAVVQAAEHGYLNILEALLANGATITDEYRGKAVLNAVFLGSSNIVEALLANGPISHEHRGEAVELAFTFGELNILEALLANGPISDEHRIQALTAIRTDNAYLLPLLANTDELRRRFRPPRPQSFHLEINLEELNRNPMHYLDRIVQKGFPLRVSILGARGVDGGGLRKEFVSHLVQSLQPHLSLTGDQLPLIELEDPNAVTKKETLRKFGVFLSDLHEANLQRPGDPCLIEQLFHPRFFDIVKLILDNQSDDQILEPLARILQEIDPSLSLVTQVILTPDNAEAKKAFADIFDFNLAKDDIAQKAKDMLLGYLAGPKAFATGLTSQLEAFIQELPCQEICTVLQGQEATAEALFRALGIQEIDASSETADLFENQKRWVKEKILGSDLAWRKAFIQWSTGRMTLAPATSIILQSTHTPGIAAHTCSNTIEFPLTATSKEAFLAALDDLSSDLQYNMA